MNPRQWWWGWGWVHQIFGTLGAVHWRHLHLTKRPYKDCTCRGSHDRPPSPGSVKCFLGSPSPPEGTLSPERSQDLTPRATPKESHSPRDLAELMSRPLGDSDRSLLGLASDHETRALAP